MDREEESEEGIWAEGTACAVTRRTEPDGSGGTGAQGSGQGGTGKLGDTKQQGAWSMPKLAPFLAGPAQPWKISER